nr:PREDICTED: junctophilin-3 [Equus przewalskii]
MWERRERGINGNLEPAERHHRLRALFPGRLEYQRPKHQLSSDDIEVISTGTPLQQESPELYRKGTTPSDLTPDDSPLQSFPVSVDEERGGDIQMLLEGRGGDYARNSWGEEKAGGSRGIRSGALRSSQPADDFRARGSAADGVAPDVLLDFPPPSRQPQLWGRQAAGAGRGEAEQLRDGDEAAAEDGRVHAGRAPPEKTLQQGGGLPGPGGGPPLRGPGLWGAETEVHQNKENVRPASCAEPAVQRLESLRLGDRAEPRLLRWDLTFSPPQKSSPVALESDEENGDELKSSTGSAPILVAMVILLNIGVAILFINFFI